MKYVNSAIGKISGIGLGCMQTNNPDIITNAQAGGLNFFVTAEAYGDDNQKLVGEALAIQKASMFIATKVGIDFNGNSAEEQFTQSRQQINASVKKCALLLGKAPLDLVGLHRLDDVHRFYSTEEQRYICAWEIALDELITLQQEGEISHIGLSEPTADQLARAVAIAKARGTSIAAVESAYSIVTRRAEINGVKELCMQENIVFIAYSSAIRGLTDLRLQNLSLNDFELSNELFQAKLFKLLEIAGDFAREHVDMFSPQYIKHNVRQMLIFQECAAQHNITPCQLALAWVQHKGAIPIPGTNNFAHLLENIESVDKIDSLVKAGVFSKLDELFPHGTFLGDPNPISIAGALDANSEELNLEQQTDSSVSLGFM